MRLSVLSLPLCQTPSFARISADGLWINVPRCVLFFFGALLCSLSAYGWDYNLPSGHDGNIRMSYLLVGVFKLLFEYSVLVLMLWGLVMLSGRRSHRV